MLADAVGKLRSVLQDEAIVEVARAKETAAIGRPIGQTSKAHVKAGGNLTPEGLPVASDVARSQRRCIPLLPGEGRASEDNDTLVRRRFPLSFVHRPVGEQRIGVVVQIDRSEKHGIVGRG